MKRLAKIYAPWGGNAEAMARDLGERPSTVRQWRTRGSVNPRWWKRIIDAARERGHELTIADFLPDECSAEHAAAATSGDGAASPDKGAANIGIAA